MQFIRNCFSASNLLEINNQSMSIQTGRYVFRGYRVLILPNIDEIMYMSTAAINGFAPYKHLSCQRSAAFARGSWSIGGEIGTSFTR
jgi:hypothetical protein